MADSCVQLDPVHRSPTRLFTLVLLRASVACVIFLQYRGVKTLSLVLTLDGECQVDFTCTLSTLA